MSKQAFNFEILKNNNGKMFLDNDAFVEMMLSLKNDIALISELGFLEDCSKDILSSTTLENTKNLIVNTNNISEFTNSKDIMEIVNFLSSNAICIVVEPNNNTYLDLDYGLIKSEIGNSITRDAVYSLILHEKVQNFAVVTTTGQLSEDLNTFKNKVLVDCDFQKNEVLFPFCCKALDSLELSIAIYKK